METVDEGRQPGRGRELQEQRPARPGQSGEGARSALEQWIAQERRRESQRPREGEPAEGDPAPAP